MAILAALVAFGSRSLGIGVPAAGVFLLLLLPAQDLVPEHVIRLSMFPARSSSLGERRP